MPKVKKEESAPKTRSTFAYDKAVKLAKEMGKSLDQFKEWAKGQGWTVGEQSATPTSAAPDYKALAKAYIENRRGPSAKDNPHYTTAEQKVRVQGMIEYLTEKKYLK